VFYSFYGASLGRKAAIFHRYYCVELRRADHSALRLIRSASNGKPESFLEFRSAHVTHPPGCYTPPMRSNFTRIINSRVPHEAGDWHHPAARFVIIAGGYLFQSI